ncbi:hypothetical protein [Baaleninema sp.]|uniref:hypothetical protein n=1 Tax=Baaleninema sp. TaxID=3101197 RepID=UPI003D0382AD
MSKSDLTLAIQFGSAFLVIFLLLGYDSLLSILLAIAGGISGSVTVSGWNDKSQPDDIKPKSLTEDNLDKTRSIWIHPTPLEKRQRQYLEKRSIQHRGRPKTLWNRISKWLGLEKSGETKSEEESEE